MSDSRTSSKSVLSFIISHPSPHLDELAAIWLLLNFGFRRYRLQEGRKPEILFMTDGEARTFALDHDGVVILGMGHGQFDDHGRVPATCSAHLVAEYLEVSRRGELHAILKRVLESDILRGEDTLSLPWLIKIQNRYGTPPLQLYEMVAMFLDGLLKEGRNFSSQCPEDFKAFGQVVTVSDFRAGLVVSDAECMSAWLRATKKVNICVVRRLSGRCSISCDGSEDGRKVITAIALGLQEAEHELLSIQDRRRSREEGELEAMIVDGTDGYVPGAEHWYLFQCGGMVLNGSESHPDAEPTLLTNAQIRDVVTAAIEAVSQPKAAK